MFSSELTVRALPDLLAELDAFRPARVDEVDWTPLLGLVTELFERGGDLAPAVAPLLAVLDRFERFDGFAGFWPIVHGLERLPDYPAALVAALRTAPTRAGVTLLLRVIATGIAEVDGVALAPLAAMLLDS